MPATGWRHALDDATNNRHHDPDENEGENGFKMHASSMPEGYPEPECKMPLFTDILSWPHYFHEDDF